MKNENKNSQKPRHLFGIRGFTFRVFEKQNWLEFNIYAPNGEWRRFFISKAGYTGLLDEVMEVGHSLLRKAQDKGA